MNARPSWPAQPGDRVLVRAPGRLGPVEGCISGASPGRPETGMIAQYQVTLDDGSTTYVTRSNIRHLDKPGCIPAAASEAEADTDLLSGLVRAMQVLQQQMTVRDKAISLILEAAMGAFRPGWQQEAAETIARAIASPQLVVALDAAANR